MKNSPRQVVPIVATLNTLNRKYGKLYCYPSQIKILELLDLYQGIKIGIATLNRWLRDAEDKQYLIRIRRIKRDKKLGLLFQSTLYKITIKGYHALGRTGVRVYEQLKATWADGIRSGARRLAKYEGPVPLKAIIESTMMFGGKKTKFIRV